MANKQSSSKSYSVKRGLRPGQDIFATPRAKDYPSVGVTLRSYGNHPKPILSKATAKTKPRTSLWKRWRLKRALIASLIVFIVIGGALGGKFLINAHKLFGGNLFSILQTTKLKGEDSGRVNILLAGNSADDVGHEGAQLTDSIMIISIDTVHSKAFLLSVPRDLWVGIGNNGHGKINEAYVDGQNNHFSDNGYPTGGMGQLQQVIESNLGLTINYYALVNYNAFRDSVNAVGGIDVVIKSTDPRGLYDPSIDYTTKGPLVKLTNGSHHLNGQQALDLARARGDNYRAYGFNMSDFDRTEHQRQMLVALKGKAVSAGVVTNPVRLSSLSDAIGNNVKTNLSLSEVRRLYELTKTIDGGNISSISLNNANGKNLLVNYRSASGESALIPAAGLDDFSAIQQLIKQLTSNNPVVQEAAKLVVLNATPTRGLAAHVRTTLEAKNLNVTDVGDALANQATTTIIDNSAGHKPATRQALQTIYGKTVVFTTANPYSAKYTADFIVVIGTDQVKAAAGATTSN
jgi:polyisoprenyl-teichoic acid--peptidoglycan teichoic acid transferase